MVAQADSQSIRDRADGPQSEGPRLSPLDAQLVGNILETCLHQLQVLGCIAPGAATARDGPRDAIHESQKIPSVRTSSNREFRDVLGRAPIPSDTLLKVEADRQFVEEVIAATLQEVRTSGTFQTLLNVAASEREERDSYDATIAREKEARERVASLEKEMQDCKKERQSELQRLDEEVLALEDELQEAKARGAVSGRYTRRTAEARVAQAARRGEETERGLSDAVQTLGIEMDNENRANTDIDTFLRRHYTELSEQLEVWMEKYDHDTEAKQQEHNNLKATHATELAHLQDLARQYSEFEAVVIEHRLQREAERKRVEQEALELRCTIKIQAWWRGVVVRRGLGRHKAPKKGKKAKKGKGKKSGMKKK